MVAPNNSPTRTAMRIKIPRGAFLPGNAAAANPISRVKRRLRAARVGENGATDETWDKIIDTMIEPADRQRPAIIGNKGRKLDCR